MGETEGQGDGVDKGRKGRRSRGRREERGRENGGEGEGAVLSGGPHMEEQENLMEGLFEVSLNQTQKAAWATRLGRGAVENPNKP